MMTTNCFVSLPLFKEVFGSLWSFAALLGWQGPVGSLPYYRPPPRLTFASSERASLLGSELWEWSEGRGGEVDFKIMCVRIHRRGVGRGLDPRAKVGWKAAEVGEARTRCRRWERGLGRGEGVKT